MTKSTLRLTLLFFLLGLTASRIGLVLHELGGHYGVASRFGCRLTELELFLFGGGWVSYDCESLGRAQQLAADLGGIALELVLGGVLYGLSRLRPRGLLGLYAAALGLLYVLHGAFYLVTGVHYGVGDGRELHRLLGAWRGALVAAGSVAILASCFAFARDFARRAAPPAQRFGARLAAIAIAVLLASAAHGALMLVERAWVADATYAASFTPERQVEIEAELRRFEREQPRTPEQVAAQRRRIEAATPRPFPLQPVLGAGMALASLAGLGLALRRDAGSRREPWSARAIAVAAAVCALSVAVVAALDAML
jgi:hypothetical protein